MLTFSPAFRQCTAHSSVKIEGLQVSLKLLIVLLLLLILLTVVLVLLMLLILFACTVDTIGSRIGSLDTTAAMLR